MRPVRIWTTWAGRELAAEDPEARLTRGPSKEAGWPAS
jgi:hypothetical protein